MTPRRNQGAGSQYVQDYRRGLLQDCRLPRSGAIANLLGAVAGRRVVVTGIRTERRMAPQAVFGISVAFSFIAWGVVTWLYLWPALANRRRADALRPILVLHGFRFVGLTFLMPGVVSPTLPASFALPAAFGDLATATLALISLAMLRNRLGLIVVWAFNILGSADLLRAFYEGNRVGLDPGAQGAAYFIPTVLVPLLMITHGLTFRLLLRTDA